MKNLLARTTITLGVLVLSALGGGCGASDKQVATPKPKVNLAGMVASAFREEATGDPVKAVELYVRALDWAATSPDHPASVAVMSASLEALVHGSVSAFQDIAATSALADRLAPATLERAGGTVDKRLATVLERAEGPFAAHLIANARLALAERDGNAVLAADMRARGGCFREAVLMGSVAWAPVTGVRAPSSLDGARAPMPAETTVGGPFAARVKPTVIRAFGCRLPLYAESSTPGVREIVADVVVPKSGVIGVGLRSPSTATLRAGGKIAIDRGSALGDGSVARFARVDATAGTLRIVVRVGMDQDYESVEIGAWDQTGRPLRVRLPTAGQSAVAVARRTEPTTPPPPVTDEERLVVALGAVATRESRTAEGILHERVQQTDTPPELLLAYARAVRGVRDLPVVKANERARAAIERTLEAWPTSWEAAIEHAVLAGARRGHAEANLEALGDLDATRAKPKAPSAAMLDAFETAVAGRERLRDRAASAFARAKAPFADTTLVRALERVAFERTGPDAVSFECSAKPRVDRTTLLCHHALRATGDRVAAERELERLRALSGASQLYLSLSSRHALEEGDLPRAARLLDAMNPGDRSLSTLFAVKGKSAVPDILKLAIVARDSPMTISGVLSASGQDPLAAFDGIAERVTSQAAGGPMPTDAATAVLAHDERYSIESTGLIHYVMLDVRRVMGTTDVDSNAQAADPTILGRETSRVLRRRIFKKDGRILLPDRTPHAAQSHADLSQLEAGDAVEAIYEGYAVPADTGNVGIDTPDLLPERTAVRDARIELRIPQGLRGSLWSHPLLGAAEEKIEAGKRVLVWRVKDRPVRRIESGIPKMDRNVGVSFSTTTWDDVSNGLRETLASLDADDPEVSAWANEAARAASARMATPAAAAKAAPHVSAPQRAIVEAVVTASGPAIKEASGMMLADITVGRSGGHGMTARTSLATHEGSRTWLIVRALRNLGIVADVVVAENEPFSDSPTFPPHFGRFMHPLALAHVDDPAKPGSKTDIWIDADVAGPPLPAGRISPELRGRMAMWPDGRIAPLPVLGNDGERDEIDIRLTVDETGNAKGQLTVLLRGRAAQDLAEALVRLVGLERQRALRGIALAWVPFATVEKVELSSSEGSWQTAIRAELSAPAYAQLEGTKPGSRTWVLPGIDPIHYVFPRSYVSTLGSTYANHGARENALAINHAAQYHVRRRVELPAAAKIARLPGPFEGKGPLFSAQRKISVAGNTIEEDFTLDVTTGTVPRDAYDAFVTEAHKTDDAFRATTRVKPPTP